MKTFLSLFLLSITMHAQALMPHGFVFLSEIDPTIQESVRYYGSDNFMGRPVPGYTVDRIIITEKAAIALKRVNSSLNAKGYQLVVYDAYRPKRAVDAFVEWSKHPRDHVAKAYYFPTLTKPQIFEEGYVSPHSTHLRGSTVDLTLISLHQQVKPIQVKERTLNNHEVIPFLDDNTVDMGSSFDLFHRVSHATSILITPEQQEKRDLLRVEMENAGFQPYDTEWWHFTLKDEPFPHTNFDFVVEP